MAVGPKGGREDTFFPPNITLGNFFIPLFLQPKTSQLGEAFFRGR